MRSNRVGNPRPEYTSEMDCRPVILKGLRDKWASGIRSFRAPNAQNPPEFRKIQVFHDTRRVTGELLHAAPVRRHMRQSQAYKGSGRHGIGRPSAILSSLESFGARKVPKKYSKNGNGAALSGVAAVGNAGTRASNPTLQSVFFSRVSRIAAGVVLAEKYRGRNSHVPLKLTQPYHGKHSNEKPIAPGLFFGNGVGMRPEPFPGTD